MCLSPRPGRNWVRAYRARAVGELLALQEVLVETLELDADQSLGSKPADVASKR